MASICIKAAPVDRPFERMRQFYLRGQFCDLAIYAVGGALTCHKLVLASIAPWISDLIGENSDAICTLILPEVTIDQMQLFIDALYDNLCEVSAPEDTNAIEEVLRLLQVHCLTFEVQESSLVDFEVTKSEMNVPKVRKKLIKKVKTSNHKKSAQYQEILPGIQVKIPKRGREVFRKRLERFGYNKRVVCHKCAKEFGEGKAEALKRTLHLLKHKMEDFKCSCKVTFENFADKERHIRLRHMRGFAECPACLKVYMISGMAQHYKKEHLKVICEKCGLETLGQKAMDSHLVDNHPELLPEEKKGKRMMSTRCNICNIEFGSTRKAHSHKRLQHEAHVCKLCDMTFETRYAKEKHRQEVHLPPKVHQCHICQKIYKTRNLLTSHNRAYHSGREWKHKCHFCDRAFFEKDRLREHISYSHTKDQPFQCRYGCGKGFNCTGNRVKHEKNIHGKTYTQQLRELGLKT